MALSFFLILLPGLPVKNSLPVEQTHSANIISFSIYENENEPRLDDFLPLFVCFGTKIFSQHQISTTLLGLVRENRATPVLTRSLAALSHIHSKTACRGFKSFCPCQKSQVSLLRYLTFSLVCGRIWQRGAPAGPPAVRVVGACSPVGCVQARPGRQPRQVLLPLPKKSGIASAVPDFFVSVR